MDTGGGAPGCGSWRKSSMLGSFLEWLNKGGDDGGDESGKDYH